MRKFFIFITFYSLLFVHLLAYFPVGVFQISPDRFSKADSIGIMVVHHYHFEGWKNNKYPTGDNIEALDYLDKTQEYGLKAMIGFNTKDLINGNFESVINRVDTLKNHPALKYWYLADEPDINFLSVKECKQLYNIIKKRDPEHPVVITISSHRPKLGGYEEACDIVIVDSYPIRENYHISKINDVKNRVRNAINVCKKSSTKVKVFVAIQSFGGKYDNVNYEYPTLAQTRYMVFSSIIEGASGIFFYSFNWCKIEHINNVIYPIVKELHFFKGFITGELVASSLASPVIHSIRKSKNNYILIAANTTNKTQNSNLNKDNFPSLSLKIMPFDVNFFELKDNEWKEIKFSYQ